MPDLSPSEWFAVGVLWALLVIACTEGLDWLARTLDVEERME
jgi:hypothetical protein